MLILRILIVSNNIDYVSTATVQFWYCFTFETLCHFGNKGKSKRFPGAIATGFSLRNRRLKLFFSS